MNDTIKKITVLGGGASGWLTAAIIAAEHGTNTEKGVQVVLVESPDVKPVGVGEGTWPTMRETLRQIGLSEKDFLRECDASFKQGSKFCGWVTGAADDSYYHPFVLPEGFVEADLPAYWQAHCQDISFAEAFTTQAHICERDFAPKQQSTPEYAAVVNYGYHLNAGKFGELLRKHCTSVLGVQHIQDYVSGVNSHDNGDIASLITRDNGNIDGDLFIDCSGAASLLLAQHYGIGWHSREQQLFNNRAMAVQVPYADPEAPIASVTVSSAQQKGWIWDIALPIRRGVGHVYASDFCTDDEAEAALRAYIAPSLGAAGAEQASVRKLAFEPGHRQEFWHKNCVAVGMAAGFIEPLEASALVMVELAAGMIRDELPVNRAMMNFVAREFNDKFHYRWDRVIDFLKVHYVLSSRNDSDYWREHRRDQTIPARLAELLALWQYRAPSRYDFDRLQEVFSAASYQYVLYGMGFKTARRQTLKRTEDTTLAQKFLAANQQKTQKFLQGLPTNRQLIQTLTNTH